MTARKESSSSWKSASSSWISAIRPLSRMIPAITATAPTRTTITIPIAALASMSHLQAAVDQLHPEQAGDEARHALVA